MGSIGSTLVPRVERNVEAGLVTGMGGGGRDRCTDDGDVGDDRDRPPPRRWWGRSLKTAAEALAALRFLGTAADGVTAEDLAIELGKSTATARYLLNTLCQEGFAARDQLNRDAIFDPEVDKVWAQVDRLVGAETSEKMRSILKNQSVESAQNN